MAKKQTIGGVSLFLLALLFLSSCTEHQMVGDLTQGTIIYEVSYPMLDSNDLRLQMFPKEMVLTFKEDRYKTELKGAGGIFRTSFISNATEKKLTQTVKVFSEKYAMRIGPEEVEKLHRDYPKHSITFLDETAELAGVSCNKVIINFGLSRQESLFFLYTKDVKLKAPNWSTPFPQIDGLLVDYQIESYGTVMRLVAKEIKHVPIEDSEFMLSKDYVVLPMDEFLPKLQQNIDAFNQ